jgi:hypothetical protein
MSTYTREENTILADGEKVAVIDKNGQLRMAKGQTEHKEGVEAFLEAKGDKEPEDNPEHPLSKGLATHMEAARLLTEDVDKMLARVAVSRQLDIPECPPEDPTAGDKTEAVVEWYRQYKPEEFAAKYGSRKGTVITRHA